MPATIGADIAAAAVAMSRSHPHAPPLNVLDVMLRGCDGARLDLAAPWLQPAAPFGQLLAAAFDSGMSPAEWAARPDSPAGLRTRGTLWRDLVLTQFAKRFGLLTP